MRRDRIDVAQRAVCLDEAVHGQTCGCAVHADVVVDLVAGAPHVGEPARLGHHQVREARAGATDERVELLLEGRMVHGMHPRADPAVAVLGRHHELCDEVRMLGLAADGRAVLAVERHVEDRPPLGLQREALVHARLDAGVVVAHGQRRQRLAGVEQRVARSDHGAQSRCFTPSCSSSSSFSVMSMRSWLNSSIGSPSTSL